MPGLCGIVKLNPDSVAPDLAPALSTLAYGRATVVERFEDDGVQMGCAHLGTGGQRALHVSDQAAVLFWGYLTRPAIPPGADPADPAAAARHVHDQYLARGKALLDDLTGAFAFALWDRRTRTLLLATDRLGMRPIYYVEHDGVLRFASEVKALLTDPALPRRLDRLAAFEFLYFRYILGDRTFFEDIRLLPPAACLECRDTWRVAPYWQVTYPDRFPKRPDRWYDQQIYEVLRTAVQRMVRPHLTYGISLSSGMDSRWIAALLAQIRPDTQAFTFGAPDSETVRLARQVADITGLKHHCLGLSPTFMQEHAERMVYISDGMHSFVDAQEFPLVTQIGDYVDVAVGGFMGSGFFGENPVYVYLRAKDVYPLRVRRSRVFLPPRPLLEAAFADDYAALEEAALAELRASIEAAPASRGFQIFAYEATRQRQRRFTFYAQLLKTPYVDMYHPIADNDVWELSVQLPPGKLAYKWALRHALGAFYPALAALPWNAASGTALDSVPVLFAKDVYRRTVVRLLKRLSRQGAASPRPLDYPNWLRGPLRPFVEETLLAPEANATGLFDPQGLKALVQGHMEGHQNATLFLGLALPFALWTRMFYTPTTPVRPDILVAGRGNEGC